MGLVAAQDQLQVGPMVLCPPAPERWQASGIRAQAGWSSLVRPLPSLKRRRQGIARAFRVPQYRHDPPALAVPE